MMARHHLKNQSGSSIVLALIASVVLGIAGLVAQKQVVSIENSTQLVRIKNLLTIRETYARTLIGQAAFYSSCNVGGNLSSRSENCLNYFKGKVNVAIPGCVLNPDFSSQYEAMTTSNICGFVLDETPANFQYTDTEEVFKFRILYNGKESQMKPFVAMVTLHADPFTTASGQFIGCTDPAKPFLKSISNNQAKCEAIETENLCGVDSGGNATEYLQSLLKQGDTYFVKTCRTIRNSLITCENEQPSATYPAGTRYIKSYNWNGDNNYGIGCEPKINPFDRWPRDP